jgi:mannose/fructose/N-acetylgalactosamine-specific phosphotransferase system component IID
MVVLIFCLITIFFSWLWYRAGYSAGYGDAMRRYSEKISND